MGVIYALWSVVNDITSGGRTAVPVLRGLGYRHYDQKKCRGWHMCSLVTGVLKALQREKTVQGLIRAGKEAWPARP